MSSWYHTYVSFVCIRLCALIDITWNIFHIVPSWFFVLVSGLKRHYVVVYLLHYLYFLMYRLKLNTPYFLLATGSYWSISTCTNYHLVFLVLAIMYLMKNSLSFDCSISHLKLIKSLWPPYIILLGFMRVLNTNPSCSWSSRLSLSLLLSSLDPE